MTRKTFEALQRGVRSLAQCRAVFACSLKVQVLWFWHRQMRIRVQLARARAYNQLHGVGTETHRQWILAKIRLDNRPQPVTVERMEPEPSSTVLPSPRVPESKQAPEGQGHFFAELGNPHNVVQVRRKVKK